MNFTFTAVSVLGFFISGTCAIFVLARDYRSRVNRIFFLFTSAIAINNFIEFLVSLTPDRSLAISLQKIEVLMLLLFSVSLFHFLYHFLHVSIMKTPPFLFLPLRVVMYAPVLILGYLNWANDIFYSGAEWTAWGYYFIPGHYFWLLTGFSGGYFLASLFLALTAIAESRSKREKMQTSLIFTGILYAVTVGVIFEVILPMMGVRVVSMVPAASVIFIVFVTIAMVRHGLFIMTPESISRNIIETMSSFLLVLDAANKIMFINSSLLKNTGYLPRELIGQPAEMIFCPEGKGAEDVCEKIRSIVMEGRTVTGFLTSIFAKDHVRIPVSMNAAMLKDNLGEGMGTLMVMRNIRREEELLEEQKKMIEELSRTKERILSILEDTTAARDEAKNRSEEIKHLYERLKVIDRMKTEFLSIVAHELREPLVPILGYADLLLSDGPGPLNEKQKQFVGSLRKEGNNLFELIESVLDVSRLESGKSIELSKKEISVSVMLEEIIEGFRPQEESSQIKIEVELQPDLPILVADPVKLKRVFLNLVGNAFKYTQKGGKIRIAGRKENNNIKFQVVDNGIGLEKNDLEAIFDKYYQVEDAQLNTKKGVGLGLTISKEIIEEHGGKMWAESEGPGKGSRFCFMLPLD